VPIAANDNDPPLDKAVEKLKVCIAMMMEEMDAEDLDELERSFGCLSQEMR
jgi:hypothetical protein